MVSYAPFHLSNMSTIEKRLTYPELRFESEAKSDNLIGVHQANTVKLDFHSRFSLVAREMRRVVKRIEQDEKTSFALFAFEVQIFQLLRNILTVKTIRLLS